MKKLPSDCDTVIQYFYYGLSIAMFFFVFIGHNWRFV